MASADGRGRPRDDVRSLVLRLVAVAAALSTVALVLSSSSQGGLAAQALVATAAVAALAAALSRTAYVPARLRVVPARSDRSGGHVEAPTAYWCAIPAPSRPQRPRAPGRR